MLEKLLGSMSGNKVQATGSTQEAAGAQQTPTKAPSGLTSGSEIVVRRSSLPWYNVRKYSHRSSYRNDVVEVFRSVIPRRHSWIVAQYNMGGRENSFYVLKHEDGNLREPMHGWVRRHIRPGDILYEDVGAIGREEFGQVSFCHFADAKRFARIYTLVWHGNL